MTTDTLAGLYFIEDEEETFSTGHVISEVAAGVYLVRYEGRQQELPMELVAIHDIMARRWSLFQTRDALDAWIAFVEEAPAGPKVLTFSKKDGSGPAPQ